MKDNIKVLADEILGGAADSDENIEKIFTLEDDAEDNEPVEEVFGPSRISCDETSCKSNTKGQCQATGLNIQHRLCASYQARGL